MDEIRRFDNYNFKRPVVTKDLKQWPSTQEHVSKATITLNRTDSFVLMLRYCANLKAIRYESTSLNRIVADKSHHVVVA